MEERTDQEWTRLLKQDDPRAVRDLWELLFTYGVNVARRYRQSEDVGRDAAVQAYQRIRTRGVHQFRFECSFRGYCRVILVREVLRLIRKQPETTAELHEQVLGEKDPRPPADPGKIRARLQPCLERLTPREQEVIALHYFKGQDPAAVASQLGISRNYVNVIACRARRKLRDCLEKHGYLTAGDVL